MKNYNRFFAKIPPDAIFVKLSEDDVLIQEIGKYGIYSDMCEPYISLVSHEIQRPESKNLQAIACWAYTHPETLLTMIKDNLHLISD